MSVASPRLVSPGAITDGVTLFFRQKMMTFFSHRPQKAMTFFNRRHRSNPFPAFQVIVPQVAFAKFSRKICTFIRVSPPGWCHSAVHPHTS